jgi:hypothetical protein
MSEHTPGPWAVVGKSEGDGIVCFVGSLEVVTTTDKDPEQYDVEADARLIAAAPELLEAAEIIEDRIAYYASLYEEGAPNIEEWGYMDNSGDMAKMRRAIAKAKGE